MTDELFTYAWTSPAAKEYLTWLVSMQNRSKRRRRNYACTAAFVFLAGIAWILVVAAVDFPRIFMLAALIPLIIAGFLMTDLCRGYVYYDPVGAVIKEFNSMNEFEIGRFEKTAMLGGDGQELQKLLYCLRISSNLRKYKKTDVILARWKTAMEHGRPYFGSSPRGKLSMDFLTQIYFFYVHRALTDYANQQFESIAKLKTEAAKQRRLEKIKEKLVDILSQNQDFPRMQELVNATYKAVKDAVFPV